MGLTLYRQGALCFIQHVLSVTERSPAFGTVFRNLLMCAVIKILNRQIWSDEVSSFKVDVVVHLL